MIEVTNENFNTIYPHLECALKNASFIAIDTELTGINGDLKNSLFDSINERYKKQRCNIQPYTIIQFGITVFQRVHNENQYKAEAFNFFLLPRSIPSKNRQIVWQIAALEFLTAYEFDFNKHVYKGISYLNEAEQATLQQQLQKNVLFRHVERSISYKEEDILKDYIIQVSEWLNTASDETSSFKIDTPTPILQYLMHKELRNHFLNVWTLSGNNMVTVIKIQPDSRKVLEQEEGSILENVLLESYIGFSKVFKLLVTLKKPIIAHNALLDFMFIHKQFYKPLPEKYTDFKNSIHQLFPTIYDTKFLSFELRELLSPEEKWKFNSLSGLVQYFTEKRGRYILGSPNINLVNKINTDKSDNISDVIVPSMKYHTAGWDSYFAGYVFIRMIHAFSLKRNEQGLTLKHFTHTELMNNVKSFANCINIIRGSTSHLRLDGHEPESTRPKWLYVKTLASKRITATQIAEKMSTFGTVDVKQCTPQRVLVAVANHRSARDILQHFKQNKELYVVPYNPIRHSPSVQFALWGSIVISSGIFVWMLHQKLQKNS